jgi:hypothetical protein
VKSPLKTSLVLACLLGSMPAMAQSLEVQGDGCVFRTSVNQIDDVNSTVSISVVFPDDPSASAGITIPPSILPLVDDTDIDVSLLQNQVNLDATLTYDGTSLKFHEQGNTDFLETTWATIKIDPELTAPTKAVVWHGLGGIPFQRKSCTFAE